MKPAVFRDCTFYQKNLSFKVTFFTSQPVLNLALDVQGSHNAVLEHLFSRVFIWQVQVPAIPVLFSCDLQISSYSLNFACTSSEGSVSKKCIFTGNIRDSHQ